MAGTSSDYRGLGEAFFRPLYGASAPIPAGWQDTSWYEFRDPADRSTYAVLEPRLAVAGVDAWLEKKREILPPGTTIVSYTHPTLDVRGLFVPPDLSKSPVALHVLLIAGPFGLRQRMITGAFSQAEVQAFVAGVAPAAGAATGWVALGLRLPLPERVMPPSAFEHRGSGAVLTVSWTAEETLPAPDLQPFIDEAAVLAAATADDFAVAETSLVVERRLLPERLELGSDCFIAQAQFVATRLPAPWRMRAPLLRLGLSGKAPPPALDAIWSDLMAGVAFLARDNHG